MLNVCVARAPAVVRWLQHWHFPWWWREAVVINTDRVSRQGWYLPSWAHDQPVVSRCSGTKIFLLLYKSYRVIKLSCKKTGRLKSCPVFMKRVTIVYLLLKAFQVWEFPVCRWRTGCYKAFRVCVFPVYRRRTCCPKHSGYACLLFLGGVPVAKNLPGYACFLFVTITGGK